MSNLIPFICIICKVLSFIVIIVPEIWWIGCLIINCVCVNSRICLGDFPKSDDFWMANSTSLSSLIEWIPGTKDIKLTGWLFESMRQIVRAFIQTNNGFFIACIWRLLCPSNGKLYATLFVQCASSLKLSLYNFIRTFDEEELMIWVSLKQQ